MNSPITIYKPSEAFELARRFAAAIRKAVFDQEFCDIIMSNAMEGNLNICHSHDHCDANMVMFGAWAEMYDVCGPGDYPDELPQDCSLWNRAWEIARECQFDGDKITELENK